MIGFVLSLFQALIMNERKLNIFFAFYLHCSYFCLRFVFIAISHILEKVEGLSIFHFVQELLSLLIGFLLHVAGNYLYLKLKISPKSFTTSVIPRSIPHRSFFLSYFFLETIFTIFLSLIIVLLFHFLIDLRVLLFSNIEFSSLLIESFITFSIVVSICNATYTMFLLSNEDYNWWWSSFRISLVVSLFYSICYFCSIFFGNNMIVIFQGLIESFYIFFIMFVSIGFVGLLSSFLVVQFLYSRPV